MQHFLKSLVGSKSETEKMLSANAAIAEDKRNNLQPDYLAGAERIEKAAGEFSDALLAAVKSDVSKAYSLERDIEKEITDIERLMSTNATQIEQWTGLLDKLNIQLMEMGDITNWVDTMQKTSNEMNLICKSLSSKSSTSS